MGCVSSKQRPFRRKSTLASEKRSSRFDSSRRVDEWIQPQVVFDRSSSKRDAKDSKLIESEMLSSNRFCDHQVEKILENPQLAVHDQELRKVPCPVVKPGIEPKLDRWNSIDSKVRLIEFEKLSSKRLSDHHQIDKEPEVQAVVPRELSKNLSVAAAPEDTELKQVVSAGWPTWLVSVAGEALVDWAPRRASTFEKLEKIGQGTYSSVYRARDLTHDKIVALKKVRFDLNDIESVKFMVELRRTVFGWKRSSLAEPRASRGTHRANPASGPIPHKPYPRGPLPIRACVLEPNPDPKQVHTGPARGQVLLLPSLLLTSSASQPYLLSSNQSRRSSRKNGSGRLASSDWLILLLSDLKIQALYTKVDTTSDTKLLPLPLLDSILSWWSSLNSKEIVVTNHNDVDNSVNPNLRWCNGTHDRCSDLLR